MIDELYCSACGCHFYEDEIAQNDALQDCCPFCGSTCIWLADEGNADAWAEYDAEPEAP